MKDEQHKLRYKFLKDLIKENKDIHYTFVDENDKTFVTAKDGTVFFNSSYIGWSDFGKYYPRQPSTEERLLVSLTVGNMELWLEAFSYDNWRTINKKENTDYGSTDADYLGYMFYDKTKNKHKELSEIGKIKIPHTTEDLEEEMFLIMDKYVQTKKLKYGIPALDNLLYVMSA